MERRVNSLMKCGLLGLRSYTTHSELHAHYQQDVGVRRPHVREGAARSEAPAELRRITHGPTGVRIAEIRLFLREEVVAIDAQFHAGALLDAPPFGERELGPVHPR